MSYKVLVVDDSTFYRRRLVSYLDEDPFIEVVAQARDGKEAILLAKKHLPDAITMDVEMPGMNGIDAVREIMKSTPTAILMISSLTKTNASATLEALSAGALDYMPKSFEDICSTNRDAILKIRRRVKALARKYKDDKAFKPTALKLLKEVSGIAEQRARVRVKKKDDHTVKGKGHKDSNTSRAGNLSKHTPVHKHLFQSSGKQYRLLAIGASTGGPQAIQSLINRLPANFPYPILLIQHMPGSFTETFAQRLNNTAKITVKLATDGEPLKAGVAYLAPGGLQLRTSGKGIFSRLVVEASPSDVKYVFEPSIDYTFDSLVKSFDGDILSIILTGMGDDGTKGCGAIKASGGTVWAQNEQTCVVYGMPKSVFQSGVVDRVIPIDDMAHDLLVEMMN